MYKIMIILLLVVIYSLPLYKFGSYYEDDEIRLGMSGPIGGIVHSLGDELVVGISTYLKHINAEGGIHGRTFKLITKDDRYEPKITAENALELIKKDKIFAFLGFVGTPAAKVALPIINKYNVPYIGAFSGTQLLRQSPKNRLVLNGRTSYSKEINALVEYFIDTKKYRNIAVLYQNDSYGRDGLLAVKEVLKKRDMRLLVEGSYKRNTLSVGHALYEISQSKPEVVIVIGATNPTAEFIKRARKDEAIKDIKFGVVSFVGSSMLLNALDERVENIVFSQVVPSPWGALSSEVGEYRNLMSKYNPDVEYSYVSLEGFFIAKMTVELFRRVGRDFTKEDFIMAMDKLYMEIENSLHVDESSRVCKCLNNVYLTYYEDGIFWDINEEN